MAEARRRADTEPPRRPETASGGSGDARGPTRLPPGWQLREEVARLGAEHPEIRRLDRLADTMDELFRVPGTGFRVGLDGLIGLVPGIGDTAVGAISAYIIYRAHRLGVPRADLVKMAAWAGVDYVVGTVPVVGDLLDFGIKANRRNVDRLIDWADRQKRVRAR